VNGFCRFYFPVIYRKSKLHRISGKSTFQAKKFVAREPDGPGLIGARTPAIQAQQRITA
jgi:hypothetical protein